MKTPEFQLIPVLYIPCKPTNFYEESILFCSDTYSRLSTPDQNRDDIILPHNHDSDPKPDSDSNSDEKSLQLKIQRPASADSEIVNKISKKSSQDKHLSIGGAT